jgi:hypothetical protein
MYRPPRESRALTEAQVRDKFKTFHDGTRIRVTYYNGEDRTVLLSAVGEVYADNDSWVLRRTTASVVRFPSVDHPVISIVVEDAEGPLIVGRPLVTLEAIYAGAPRGDIGSVRMAPANHHRTGYFDVIYCPAGSTRGPDLPALLEEIEGKHPLCSLCHRSRVTECTGHRIGIRLPFYMIQPHFREIFVKFLNAICLNIRVDQQGRLTMTGCGSPRDKVVRRGTLVERLNGTVSTCPHPHCGVARQGTYKTARFVAAKYGGLEYRYGEGDGARDYAVALGNLMTYLTLTQTPPVRENVLAAAVFFGMHLDIRTMVTNMLYLPPYQLRPNGLQGAGYETTIYKSIALACQGALYQTPPDSINAHKDGQAMYGHIFEEIEKVMIPKEVNPESKTLYHGLSTKYGFVRQFITGGFSFNVGRGVAIPSDGNLGEFIISRYFQKLNTTEVANRYNMERLRILAQEGLVSWLQDRKSGDEVRYKPGMTIHLGDTVTRHLLSGDTVVANRQPTLHRGSLMAHFARFAMTAAVALHRCETTPYNADFDGDEMNLYPGRTRAAVLELRSVAHVINNIMGPGAPAMGPIFHELAIMMILSIRAVEAVKNPADYLAALTPSVDLRRRLASYTRRRSMALNAALDDTPIRTYGDVCSLLFPEDFCYAARGVLIVNGILIEGEFEKSNIGLPAGSITHMLSFYPKKRMGLFLNDVCRVCDVYMETNAVTFDPSHMVQGEAYYAKIAELSNHSRKQLEAALQRKAAARSEIERNQIEREIVLLAAAPLSYIMRTIGQTKKAGEARIAAMVKARASDEEIEAERTKLRAARIRNVFEIMYKSKARGSEQTAMQMVMTLGPQYMGPELVNVSDHPWVRNPKAAPGPDGRPRQTIIANGIIESSFINGLTPEQYAIHAAPVRYQVVRGKLDVSGTGYTGKQMSAIYSLMRTDPDLATVMGRTLITRTMGGFIDPTALVVGKVDGHGYASFLDPKTLVGSVNYVLAASDSAPRNV